VKVLHTSDWHVGKTIRGRSRIDEHRAVLAEIAQVADANAVHLVLVAGDLFDVAAPTPDAEDVVYNALLDLTAERTRPVVVIAGNHDSPARLAAVAPLFALHGVHVCALPSRPDQGGVLDIGDARLALLPFPSQRVVADADALMRKEAAEVSGNYAERVHRILDALCESFDEGRANLVIAHLMVWGGVLGGGERGAHTIFDYWVPGTAFPATAQYVALGHLHRAQRLDGPSPLHYCGSPLQLDFGEVANEPSVNVITVAPGRAGVTVDTVPLHAGRRLRLLRGTPDQLVALAGTTGDDHVKLVVDSGPRPGLADDLREHFPTAVEVMLAATTDAPVLEHAPAQEGRTPHDLFCEYLDARDARDDRVVALFDELVDEVPA
jgi:exonuclease SbcD